MSRDLTVDMVTELTASSIAADSDGPKVALLAVMQFDSGTLRMWSGYGNIVWDGETFTGGGNLIGISAVQETQDLKANGITMSMSGIPSDQIALALNERSRGRPFQMYLAMVADDNTIVTDPYRLFTGIMNVIGANDTGQTSSLTLSVENRLIVGQRSKVRRYTSEDQKKTYSTDEGYDLINQLQDKEVVW